MAHYLVTGAAGFIGARVTEVLLHGQHTVWGLDNLNQAYDVRVKQWRLARLMDQQGFKFSKLDISDRQAIEAFINTQDGAPPFEAVIHLAARAGVRQSVEDPWIYIDTNITGTLNMLHICHRLGIPKFILASTSSVYGANAPLPTPEDADSSHPLQAYAASKKGAEALCHVYHSLYGLDVTVFRYFTVYGPAGRPDMSMFRFTQWISEGRPVRVNGSGEQSRGYTYIDDIARGTILGLKPMGYQVINLGGHETIQINQLIHKLEEIIGRKAQIEYLPANPAEMMANWAQVEKAKKWLDWQPQVGLGEGIRKLVDWYNVERSWASQVETD